jgi:YD repeat-containing protein
MGSKTHTYEAYQRTVNGTTEYLQNFSITYDELNRVSQVTDPRATIRYEYDAVGNRRHVWSYNNNGPDGNISTGARATSANNTSIYDAGSCVFFFLLGRKIKHDN